MIRSARSGSFTLSASALSLILGVFLAPLARGNDYGPFPPSESVHRVSLHRLPVEERILDREAMTDRYRFIGSAAEGVFLEISYKEGEAGEGWYAGITAEGRVALAETYYSPGPLIAGGWAYSADLNRNDVQDYVIYTWLGGCGLAAHNTHVTFLLSSGGGYRPVTVTTKMLDFEPFIWVEGRPAFIHTGFGGVSADRDGKPRNFWIFNLLVFEGDRLEIRNDLHPNFPRVVWYSYAPNYEETDKITAEQREELLRKVQNEIRSQI